MLGALEIISITLVAAAIAAWAQYIFKKNLRVFEFSAREIKLVLTHEKTLLGLGMYAASLVLYLYALSNAPLVSFVYPIFASTFIFVLLISRYALREHHSLHRVAGIMLIIAGIIMIAFTFPK